MLKTMLAAAVACLTLSCQNGLVGVQGEGGGGGEAEGPPLKCQGGTCAAVGQGQPFPTDGSKDGNLQDATGVKLNEHGDLILGSSQASLQYMWIANTEDIPEGGAKRGTLSKVDTHHMREVARYFTVTCRSSPGGAGCQDVNGLPIKAVHDHLPSRTAVDFNMDVWVANRCTEGGQPSATKIANDPVDCIDRNHDGKIDTSADRNGDGVITWDCNGDGKADTLATACSGSLAGKPPEFLGDDDECILMTVNYGDVDDIGRSICLDGGKSTVGASDAWVGTYARPENSRGNNRYYKINGQTGKIEHVVDLPAQHHAYGCMADAHNIIWSTDIGDWDDDGNAWWNGSLTYFQTVPPYQVGTLLRGPSAQNPWKDGDGEYHHYGIAIDASQHVWLGGLTSSWVLRYRPDRQSFDTLGKGAWTRIDLPAGWWSRGIAADDRGKVWVAIHQGYLLRLDQNIADGVHDRTKVQLNQDYWKTASAENIGVGVDTDGNVWAVGHQNNTASRLDVDHLGGVMQPPTAQTKNVKIGAAPYTYSDFTGFGLRSFVRPQGRWTYQHRPCPEGVPATWHQVAWKATTPPGTGVALRVRTGDSLTTFGSWSKPFQTSPAMIGPGSAGAVSPNPATTLHVEFTLFNTDKAHTPTLHEYMVSYSCIGAID
jgi:hypothetical protein